MNPPRYVLQNIFRPYGARLYRAPKPVYGNRPGFGPPQRPSWEFKDNDYITFYGPKYPMSNWSVCRACQKVCWGDFEREQHRNKDHGRCVKATYEALRILRQDKKCAVCNAPVENVSIKMGVYLCSQECTKLWKHEDLNQMGRRNLKEALRLAGFKET